MLQIEQLQNSPEPEEGQTGVSASSLDCFASSGKNRTELGKLYTHPARRTRNTKKWKQLIPLWKTIFGRLWSLRHSKMQSFSYSWDGIGEVLENDTSPLLSSSSPPPPSSVNLNSTIFAINKFLLEILLAHRSILEVISFFLSNQQLSFQR
jgi:hypothetical protein